MSGDDPKEPPPDEVPRARDLLRPAGTTEGEYLDNDQIAQIVHWFGLPSIDPVADAKVPDRDEGKGEAARTLRRRAEVSEHVEPAMIARMERHVGDGDAIMRVQPEPKRPWERPHLSVVDESLVPPPFDENEQREIYIPDQLARDLRIRTPQAALRDLHRPETYFDIRYQLPWDDGYEPPGADPMAPIRAIIRQDYRPAAPTAVRTACAALEALRATLAAPWAEAKRPAARAREAELEAGKSPDATSVVRVPEGSP